MPAKRRQQLTVRLFLLVAIAWTVFLLVGGAAGAGAPPHSTIEYVVEPGDTLWAVAGMYLEPGQDRRVLVANIKQATGLETSTIFPGQVLHIPHQ